MATTRKRTAKNLPAGMEPASVKNASATDEPGGAVAKARDKTAADNPASESKRASMLFEEQLIRERAYAIWIEEGQPDGRDLEHWTRARGEIEREAA